MSLDVADHDAHKTRLLSRPCGTCILNPPGQRINLPNARITEVVREALSRDSFIVCHSTLSGMAGPDVKPAVCRGFADRYDTTALRLIRRLWGFIEVDPPSIHP